MTAFGDAAAALAADANMGYASSYTVIRSGATSSPVTLRAVLSHPVEEFDISGGRGVVAPKLMAMIVAADLSVDPAPGDQMTLPDGTTWDVSVAERDIEAVSWRLHLKRP